MDKNEKRLQPRTAKPTLVVRDDRNEIGLSPGARGPGFISSAFFQRAHQLRDEPAGESNEKRMAN